MVIFFKLIIAMIVVCMFLGCEYNNLNSFKKKSILHDSVPISIDFYKFKYNAEHNSTYLYGTLHIKGNKIMKYVNLNCIKLEYMGINSKGVSVDSVASFLTEKYSVNNNTLSIDLYWIFDKKRTFDDIEKFNIIIEPLEINSCVTFQ